VDLDYRLDCLLAAYSLDLIPRFEVHCDWVPRGGYGLVELFLLLLLLREARMRERGNKRSQRKRLSTHTIAPRTASCLLPLSMDRQMLRRRSRAGVS
jgi:hypothetical protein